MPDFGAASWQNQTFPGSYQNFINGQIGGLQEMHASGLSQNAAPMAGLPPLWQAGMQYYQNARQQMQNSPYAQINPMPGGDYSQMYNGLAQATPSFLQQNMQQPFSFLNPTQQQNFMGAVNYVPTPSQNGWGSGGGGNVGAPFPSGWGAWQGGGNMPAPSSFSQNSPFNKWQQPQFGQNGAP